MSTDLKLALTTTAAALLMIIAFSFTAILH
ncbi:MULTISPECIES: YnhF family membrane protein [Pantoea]|jgi:hypothetical protein|uniref:YnhF family membrane protein n=1 Tax=Pantoea dispersa TaxID=59814 RepID=A0ABY3A3J1_9GAMM|nr:MULTISPECIES: YnhF family membrane protein [Pantoea]MBK4771206.1 YnhF family membrane protein [Pantoea sp. Morm]ERH67033.1 hypothetical protein N172_01415 [Pantoea dispersa EGD-AAK13]KAA6103615.1 YnhF family membrane protein [Pantoea sp. B_9]KAA6116584.1 YnhF family membrane protein [Pantoea sp. B_10]KAA8669351.1 YnhF family membrane protein [Pantoea dispersa]